MNEILIQDTIIAYKLFRVLKNGDISPLFINKKQRLSLNTWIPAEKNHKTNGYVYRPFWHCTLTPNAPHLTEKGRAWYEIEIKDYKEYKKPKHQGGTWLLADSIKILKKL